MTRPSTSEAMHKTAEPAESADKVGDSAKQTTDETSYIDAPNEFGNTALHWACLGGHLDVVQLLLSRGASPAVPNHKDQIPLDLAAFNNHMHVVEHFLAQSRDLEDGNAKEGGLDSGAQDLAMADDVTRGADRPDRAES
ncbi:ankyrin repeat-containing domain protein [Xylariaceae sp. FL0016]|nr:ankyrin repeat-containing domain protein [Xylariaceae sp. FL0016]